MSIFSGLFHSRDKPKNSLDSAFSFLFGGTIMNNYCAFSKEHKCLKWTDYELIRYELEEADDLCHSNWIEIQHLQDRVSLLEKLLRDAGIEIPTEY